MLIRPMARTMQMDRPGVAAANGPVAPPGGRLRDYATTELARAMVCLGWRGARVHAGVHQARKSIRRVRATLALGMPGLGAGAGLIDRELRRINRQTSKLRDAQALVAILDLLLESADDAETARVLRRARRTAAGIRARCARSIVGDDGVADDRRALLATLLAALSALPWDAVGATGVDRVLRRSLAGRDAAGARAGTTGREEDWHRWRRRARRLSQQHRALGDLAAIPRTAQRHDKRLAVLLGEVQDCALLREHLGKGSRFARADRPLLRTLAEHRAQHLRGRVAKMTTQAPVPPAAAP
jgi:CHAD domain-containing protein